MTLYGYMRVSTEEQTFDLQEQAILKHGVAKTNLYREKISGISSISKRQSFDHLKSQLKSGDAVVVWKLDRLGRSLADLISLVNWFEEVGVDLISITEGIDTKTPGGKFYFHMIAALAQFERDLISQRVTAGMEAAKAEGRHVGRKPSLDPKKVEAAVKLYESGQSAYEIGDILGVSYKTVQRTLKAHYEGKKAA